MHELSAYFHDKLPGINGFLDQETARLDGLVRDVARYALLGGGKRIRPVLTLLSAGMLGHQGDEALPLACALEMLHSATLIHDDILDGARLRRGAEAAHLRFGRTEAILAGDALLALANRLGAGYDIPRINFLLAEGIMATAAGEIMEIANLRRPTADRQLYLNIVMGKTARLIETACRCGAVLAGADRPLEDAAGAFGLNLGIAFQLVDDALDYADPAHTGKPAGGDLRDGKPTLPLLLLLDDGGHAGLLERLAAGDVSPDEQQALIAEIQAKGYGRRTREQAGSYAQKAKQALEVLPEGLERRILVQAADYVLARDR